MKSFFILVFCKGYETSILLDGDSEKVPEFSGLCAVIFPLCMNILTIFLIIRQLFGFSYSLRGITLYTYFVVCFSVIYMGYNFFLKGDKFKKIYKEFKKESKYAEKNGMLITWLYVISSFFCPIILAIVLNIINVK